MVMPHHPWTLGASPAGFALCFVPRRRYEIGEESPAGEAFSHAQAPRDALPEVPDVRLRQTLYVEYPALQPYLVKLETKEVAERLTAIGFFALRPSASEAPLLGAMDVPPGP